MSVVRSTLPTLRGLGVRPIHTSEPSSPHYYTFPTLNWLSRGQSPLELWRSSQLESPGGESLIEDPPSLTLTTRPSARAARFEDYSGRDDLGE
jgi:hypothetical protein